MEVMRCRCDNGLEVFVIPVDGSEKVSGAFAVRGGWRYERKNERGAGHRLEHVMLHGTKNRPTIYDLSAGIEEIGGRMHAFTNDEAIVYFCHVPAAHINLLCEVLADIVLNPLFSEKEAKIELGITLEELRKYKSSANDRLDTIFSKLLFGSHPVALPGVGTEYSLRKITYEMMQEYYRSCFVAPNCAMFIAGGISDPSALLTEVSRLFSPLANSASSRERPPVIVKQVKPDFKVATHNIPQMFIKLGVRCPDLLAEDELALKLIRAIFVSGWSSRLYSELITKRGIVYEADLEYNFRGDASYFAYSGGINRNRWLEGVRIILNEMAKLREGKVDERIFERAKFRSLEYEAENFYDPYLALMHVLRQWQNFQQVTLDDNKFRIEQIRKVSADDIMRTAQKFFQDRALNLAALGRIKYSREKIASVLHF